MTVPDTAAVSEIGLSVTYALIAQHNSSSPYEDLQLKGK
jgi:hypothetical protein